MSKPKFIKEIEKSEGKERAKCGRWYIRVYGELDHKPMVELESLEIVIKELHKLEEENKKLKEWNNELIENHKKDIAILCEENKKLKEELKETQETLEHSDSFFSIMRDVLANETITNEELASILYCVIHFECGDLEMSKKEVEIAEKFWYRDYV